MTSETPSPPHARTVSLPLWVYRHRLPILAVFGGLLLAGVLVLGYFTTRVVARFDGRRWDLPSRIYSDLYVLRPGDAVSVAEIQAKLARLYYQQTEAAPERPGRYRIDKDAIEIQTRPFRYPGHDFAGLQFRLTVAGKKVKSIADPTGQKLPALFLEPERLGSVFSAEL